MRLGAAKDGNTQGKNSCSGRGRRSLLVVFLLSLGACVSMPPNESRNPSYAMMDTGDTTLGQGVAKDSSMNNGNTGALLLGDGLDAFVARAVLAHVAQRSLDVQYYLFHRDLTGRLLIDELLKAADRGVRVRLLVDDMDMAGRDMGVATLQTHPNVEVRLFNPFARNRTRMGQYISRFGSVTRRMHNKSFTADNQATIVGGRNIGNEYFSADPDLAFADMDVLLAGPAVKEVSRSFDLYWNSALSYPVSNLGQPVPPASEVAVQREALRQYVSTQESSVYIQALNNSKLASDIENDSVDFRWAKVEIFYDLPEKITASRDQTELHLSEQLAPYFANVEKEAIILSPYFVPGKGGTKGLCAMSARGVDVTVLTNSLASTDVPVVHAGYIRYRKKLLQCGVHVFEANSKLVMADPAGQYQREDGKKEKGLGLSRTSLHAKMFVFDREKTFIGSLNLDPRSVTENTEIGSVIYSSEIGGELARIILDKSPNIAFSLSLNERGKVIWSGFEEGRAVTYDKEPHTGFFKRLGVQIMRVLPIESQI
ncbi:MAG: phospholipase D family protein [Halieaceae bacterium]|jgi:cardiolipin synthase C|nr:phospholipase D family protein [Halieaceae bacterium]